MHSDQLPYRQLIEDQLYRDLSDAGATAAVLSDWRATNAQEVEWLAAFAQREGDPVPTATVEELWRLYALDRVLQTLQLGFQVGPSEIDPWAGPPITLDAYTQFATALGLAAETPPVFCPFDHEIVRVDVTEQHGTLDIVECLWPRLMLGPLLVSRAGVRVRASPDVLDKVAAEQSPLYWAYRRRSRTPRDLSHGWGSNSQWRTSFRRDYRRGDVLWFNVDGALDLSSDQPPASAKHRANVAEDGLTRSRRAELLTNRCYVRRPGPQEPWVYDDTLSIDVARQHGAGWELPEW